MMRFVLTLTRNVLDMRLIAVAAILTAAIGCSMFGGDGNSASNSKSAKGISAEQVCQLLAHPEFENKSPYNGESCSGSTYFGAKDAPAGSRSAFSYYVLGDKDAVQKINLSMSKRPDGATFFAAQGNAVAKMISGQPLPKEIEEAITTPLPSSGGLAGYGDRFTTNAVVGNAKVEMVRTNSDSGYTLTFQF